MKIIFIDDENIILEFYKCFMTGKEHFSVFESNSKKALKTLTEEEFDIAVIDYKMPEISGVELINKAREIGVSTEFIIVSCVVAYEDIRPLLTKEIAGFFSKPLDRDKFFDLIKIISDRTNKIKNTAGNINTVASELTELIKDHNIKLFDPS